MATRQLFFFAFVLWLSPVCKAQLPDLDDHLIYKPALIKAMAISKQSGWLFPSSSSLSNADRPALKHNGKDSFLISESWFDSSGHFTRQVRYDIYGNVSVSAVYDNYGRIASWLVYRMNTADGKHGYLYKPGYSELEPSELSSLSISYFDSSNIASVPSKSRTEQYNVRYKDNVIEALELTCSCSQNGFRIQYTYEDGWLSLISGYAAPHFYTWFKYDERNRLRESMNSDDLISVTNRHRKYYYNKFDLPVEAEYKHEGVVMFRYE